MTDWTYEAAGNITRRHGGVVTIDRTDAYHVVIDWHSADGVRHTVKQPRGVIPEPGEVERAMGAKINPPPPKPQPATDDTDYYAMGCF